MSQNKERCKVDENRSIIFFPFLEVEHASRSVQIDCPLGFPPRQQRSQKQNLTNKSSFRSAGHHYSIRILSYDTSIVHPMESSATLQVML